MKNLVLAILAPIMAPAPPEVRLRHSAYVAGMTVAIALFAFSLVAPAVAVEEFARVAGAAITDSQARVLVAHLTDAAERSDATCSPAMSTRSGSAILAQKC